MKPEFHISLRSGRTFASQEAFASDCGYSLSYISTLRRKGLGWDAIWNRKHIGTPAQRARKRRKAARSSEDASLFEPVPE